MQLTFNLLATAQAQELNTQPKDPQQCPATHSAGTTVKSSPEVPGEGKIQQVLKCEPQANSEH